MEEATPAAWRTWLGYVSVDESNDEESAELADVFKQVRRNGLLDTTTALPGAYPAVEPRPTGRAPSPVRLLQG